MHFDNALISIFQLFFFLENYSRIIDVPFFWERLSALAQKIPFFLIKIVHLKCICNITHLKIVKRIFHLPTEKLPFANVKFFWVESVLLKKVNYHKDENWKFKQRQITAFLIFTELRVELRVLAPLRLYWVRLICHQEFRGSLCSKFMI